MQLTKWQLLSLLTTCRGAATVLIDSHGARHSGILQSVQREDGSGRSFNVTLSTARGNVTIHVRTVD